MNKLKILSVMGSMVFSFAVSAGADCQTLKDKVAIDAEMMNGTSQQMKAVSEVLEGSKKALARVQAKKDMLEDYHIHYHEELNKKLSNLAKFIEAHAMHATKEHEKLKKEVEMTCQ